MNILDVLIKCISWINYAIADSCSVGERIKLVDFLEDTFLYMLPDKVRNLLVRNHFSLKYLNYVIRKKNIDNDEIDELYGTIKEAVKEVVNIEVVNEDRFITKCKCYEQIEVSADSGIVLGVFIRSVLNILNIMDYNDYDEGMEGLNKCARWNHFPSMVVLSYVNYLIEDYHTSLYWLEMVKKLNPMYLNDSFNERINELKAAIGPKQYNQLIKKVEDDSEIHNLLFDDRLGKWFNNSKINSNVINVIYSKVFNINELEKLLFDDQLTKWNNINELVNSLSYNKERKHNSKKGNYKYKDIIDSLNDLLDGKSNKPLIINCKGDIYQSIIINEIKSYLRNCYIEMVNFESYNMNKFVKIANDNNSFYKALVNSKYEKVFYLYENIKKSDNRVQIVMDFINPNERYYFDDLNLSIDKNKLASIIVTANVELLPKTLVEMSKVISKKPLSDEDKKDLFKEYFKIKQKETNNKAVFDNNVYDYISSVPEDLVATTVNKILSCAENINSKVIGMSDLKVGDIDKKKKIGFLY